MKRLQNLPLRRKLTLVTVVTCAAVLLAACAALAAYELFDFRRTMVRDATVLADILGTNTRAALAFEDEETGKELLQALQAEPHVVFASLHTKDGRPFVTYLRAGEAMAPVKRPEWDGHRFEDGYLVVFRPITLGGKRIGTIGLHMDQEGVYGRLRLLAGIAGLVLTGSLLLAFLLSSWLQRFVSGPILALTATARAIAARKDYSVRAERRSGDEVGELTDTFNEMLAGIQERERALHDSNVALQAEIGERKQAEAKARAQLARLAQLHQITRATGERQDLPSIFQVVIRSLEDHLPIDFSCICLYDPVAQGLTVASVGPRSEPVARKLGLTEGSDIPIDRNGLSRCVRGQLVHEPDITEVRFPFPERLVSGGLHSLVAAPLLVESQVFGVLVAARRAPDSFSSGECEFLRQLGEHVALAAHQAQLYGALQRAYEDLRQSQQTLLQQERLRALGQMASGIAHDINNAISPVTLYTESLLETEPGLSERARDYLTTIQHAVDDVAATVSRMREFYRRSDQQQRALLPVSLNRLVPQVLNLTRVRWSDMPQRNGAMIDLRTELASDLPTILGVESELREALTNLIFNAVDAMPTGGTLTLRTRAEGVEKDGSAASAAERTRAILEVVDTGAGMDEDTRRRCLEPFFTTKGERGTGLGLAMVYGIVQRHGAEIEIDSAPGRGTCMRLLFPVPASAERASDPGYPAPIPPRMRLLIVDDDPLIIKSLRDALEGDGHEVVSAGGGQAGIDAFLHARQAERPFAAVITDLGMPYVDGRKVAEAVKAASPATPVLMLTGWGQRMSAEGEIPPHVDYVLGKPPKLRELRVAFVELAASAS